MKKLILVASYWLLVAGSFAQNIEKKLQTAYLQFEADSQLRHAISSLYVINAKTGEIVFDKNPQIGLAPASTQKIITAVTAFELLGRNFRYKTYIGYDIGIKNNELQGNLYFEGYGDPTLGSPRWESTKDSTVLKKISTVLARNKIKKIKGDIWIHDMSFGVNPVPGGWIWDDIGNYYGAGSWGFNWHENQYDLILKPGSYVKTYTEVSKTNPTLISYNLGNFITTGEKGSGDNGYIYYSPYSNIGFATGTIPSGVQDFTISGSIPQPAKQFGYTLTSHLAKEKILFNQQVKTYTDSLFAKKSVPRAMFLLDSLISPSLDSITYWFLKKSINLYGESILKTLSFEKIKIGLTDTGAAIVKDFWKQRGLDEEELNIYDGSGLSPLNRVTTHAQVEILKYAKTKDWYPYFYDALPEYNKMKMKSGSIKDVKGFCGYQKSGDGNEYIFSFLVNNYNGPSSGVVNKMYKVLDVLK
jgi:serine-type D-Ala-D-Ala carboxypeptidase/endopeptidase (penicillin-binding protein 4)